MKDFDGWNELKKALNETESPPLFKEREVWWCSLGHNIGVEQDGKGTKYQRPVLILRKFSAQQFIGVPSTRTDKRTRFYSFVETDVDTFNFVLSQARVFDARRLHNRIVTLLPDEFEAVKANLKALWRL